MKNNQKGSVLVWMIVVIVIIAGAGLYFYSQSQSPVTSQETVPTAVATSGVSANPPIINQSNTTKIPTTTNVSVQNNVPINRDGWKTYTDQKLGLSFQYPASLNSNFATLNAVSASIVPGKNLDANKCYVSSVFAGTERAGMTDSQLTINGMPVCASVFSDPGAGQLYTSYYYTFYRNGNYVALIYEVHTPNGCSAYTGTSNYQTCQNALANSNALIMQPIQTSVGSLRF